MSSQITPQPVFVVNDANSGVNPKDYSRFKSVYVCNAACTGTAVDTYTKLELDAKFQSIQQSMDALAAPKKDGETSLSVTTTAWIDSNIFLIREKITKTQQHLDELLDDYEDFKSFVMEMINMPHAPTSDDELQVSKIAKTTDESEIQVIEENVEMVEDK